MYTITTDEGAELAPPSDDLLATMELSRAIGQRCRVVRSDGVVLALSGPFDAAGLTATARRVQAANAARVGLPEKIPTRRRFVDDGGCDHQWERHDAPNDSTCTKCGGYGQARIKVDKWGGAAPTHPMMCGIPGCNIIATKGPRITRHCRCALHDVAVPRRAS